VSKAASERLPNDEEVLALLADTHDRIGIVEQRVLHWVPAMAEHQAALALRRRIGTTPRRSLDLAQTWLAIGDCTYIGHDVMPPQWRSISPVAAYESSLRALDGVPASGVLRGERLDALARAHARLGGFFSNSQYADPRDPQQRCLRHHQAALDAFRERVALDRSSATARRNLADQQVMMATAQLFVRDYAGALASTNEALEELRPLAAADRDSAEAQHDISFALLIKGRALMELHELDGAEQAFRDDIAILLELAADASNLEARRDMSSAYENLAYIRGLRGDRDGEAKYHLEAARARKAFQP
jgi:tetratricopeptide (TPR) repeat protein